MNIKLHSPKVRRPIVTPFGVLEKQTIASVRLNASDNFSLEVETLVKTGDSTEGGQTGVIIKRLTIIADEKSPFGVSAINLRSIPIRELLEAIVHCQVGKTSKFVKSRSLNILKSPSREQKIAARIVLENPGKRHADLLSRELGITVQSARNLISRTRKSGLLPSARTSDPASPNYTFRQMSDEGDYIHRVLTGKAKGIPPSQRRATKKLEPRKPRKEGK